MAVPSISVGDAHCIPAEPRGMQSPMKNFIRSILKKFDIGAARNMRLQALDDVEKEVGVLLENPGEK